MKTQHFEEYCQLGEEADGLLKSGRTRDALKAYESLAQKLSEKKSFDSYIAGKVTLGTIRCHIKLGNFKRAFEIWHSEDQETVFGTGIYALEAAQTTVQDMIIYDMLCAFLHTLSDGKKAAVAGAVNQYLSRVCEQAFDEGDRNTMILAINNWKQHLKDIFDGRIPLEFARSLIDFEKTLGETVKPQAIDFPAPTSWEKPSDFLELSRFVDRKTKVG